MLLPFPAKHSFRTDGAIHNGARHMKVIPVLLCLDVGLIVSLGVVEAPAFCTSPRIMRMMTTWKIVANSMF